MFDSIESLNKFFTKLKGNIETIQENEEKSSDTLSQILKQDEKEYKEDQKRKDILKRQEQRAARNKKREEADTPLMERLFGKKSKNKKGINWLALILGGALVIGGLVALLKKFIDDKVEEVKENIQDGISDFFAKLTGQVKDGEKDLVKDAEEEARKRAGKEDSPDLPSKPSKTEEKEEEPKVKPAPRTPQRADQPVPEEEKVAGDADILDDNDPEKLTETITKEKKIIEERETNKTIENQIEIMKKTGASAKDVVGNVGVYAGTLLQGIGGIVGDTLGGLMFGSGKTTSQQSSDTSRPFSSSPSTSPVVKGDISKGVGIARRLMSDMNISSEAASGIVGNLMHESGLKPDNVEDGKGFNDGPISNIPAGTRRVGYGYGQWTNDRLENFRKWLKDRGKANQPATDEDNYQYLLHELRGAEPLKNHWKSGTSIPQDNATAAADWFMMNWERPGVPHRDARQQYAEQVNSAIKEREDTKGALQFQSGGSPGGKQWGPSWAPWNWGKGGDKKKQSTAKPKSQPKKQNQAAPKSKPKGGSGGNHISIATKHIKKDEALSSLTPGTNDWIREGGNSVKSKTPWSKVTQQTTLHAYLDSVGQPTIGWGSTYYDNISAGKQPVKMGDKITKAKADKVLHTNVAGLNKKYQQEMGGNWKKMSDSQRAGLLSMGYNAPNFYSSNTFAPKLKKALQAGDMKAAASNLSWGGPSATRIKESQAMLRNGPAKLSETGLMEGGVVPGSGSGDQFKTSVPKGSLVLNREANEVYTKFQTGGTVGGMINVSTKTSNDVLDRFTSANDTHSIHFSKNVKRPIVVIDIPEESSSSGSGGTAVPPSEFVGQGMGTELNMNAIRNKIHRVSAGKTF